MALGDHATVALDFRAKVKVLLPQVVDLLVSHEKLLAELHDFLAGDSDLVLHVRNEQVLVQLVNVGDSLQVPILVASLRNLMRMRRTVTSTVLLATEVERVNRVCRLHVGVSHS